MERTRIVIGRAAAAGRDRLPFLFGLAALIFIPLGLLDALDDRLGQIDTDELDDLRLLAGLATTAVHVFSALLGEVLYAGAVAIAVISTPAGKNPSLRRIIATTRWRTLIAVDLLFALGVFVSVLLLIVPAIFFFARYALTAVVAELEELGVRDAFRRSAELSRGARRLTFGLLFSTIILSDLATDLAKTIANGLGADSFIAEWAASSASEILFNPIVGLLSVALALELGSRARNRHPDAVA